MKKNRMLKTIEMKSLIWLALVLFFAGFANAQSSSADLDKAVKDLTELYSLNAEQTDKLVTIQQRRLDQIRSIDNLKSDNFEQYLKKRRTIRRGAEGSLRRLLTADQVPVFNRQLAERRKTESDLIKKMRQEGAAKDAIELAVLKLEDTEP